MTNSEETLNQKKSWISFVENEKKYPDKIINGEDNTKALKASLTYWSVKRDIAESMVANIKDKLGEK